MKEEYEVNVSLWEILYLLKKKAWIIIAVTVLIGTCFGCWSAFIEDEMYICQAGLYIPYVNSKDKAGDNQVQDYLDIMMRPNNMEETSKALNGKVSASEISTSTRVKNTVNTRIINISVTSSTPQRAEMIANAILRTTQNEVAKQLDVKKPVIIQKADKTWATTAKNTKREILIGLFLGFVCSCIVVIFIYSYKTQMKACVEKDINKAKEYLG